MTKSFQYAQYNRSDPEGKPAEQKKSVKLGKAGEASAAGYLKNLGYRVLQQNYRKPYGEIDLIAQAPDRTLVFIEVKTMIYRPNGIMPEDQLTSFKLRKVQRMAQLFANQHPELINEGRGWRIDLLAIQVKPNEGEHEGRVIVRHYKNI